MNSGQVAVALLGRPRGNRGELTAVSLSSDPGRFGQLHHVILFHGDLELPHEVENAWWHQNVLIIKFIGVDSISDAEKLSGAEVRIPAAERVALEPGAYFDSDLIGCRVTDRATGADLGAVTALQDAGGPGLLELEGGTLIPFARDLCISIDTEKREIVVALPEGLLELNKP